MARSRAVESVPAVSHINFGSVGGVPGVLGVDVRLFVVPPPGGDSTNSSPPRNGPMATIWEGPSFFASLCNRIGASTFTGKVVNADGGSPRMRASWSSPRTKRTSSKSRPPANRDSDAAFCRRTFTNPMVVLRIGVWLTLALLLLGAGGFARRNESNSSISAVGAFHLARNAALVLEAAVNEGNQFAMIALGWQKAFDGVNPGQKFQLK